MPGLASSGTLHIRNMTLSVKNPNEYCYIPALQCLLCASDPHCQVIALQGLISVSSDEHAGLLGSSWTIILRTISSVESLVSELRRSPKQGSKTAGSFSLLGDMDKTPSTAFGRLLNQIGLANRGSIDGRLSSVWNLYRNLTQIRMFFVVQ